MYKLYFYKDNLPPVLLYNEKYAQLNNYIIGNVDDPHWKLYPKKDYLEIEKMAPTTYVFTDYSVDSNNFLYYMPDNFGPTLEYATLLRNHFRTIRKYIKQAQDDAKQKENEEKKQRILQLKNLIKEQESKLKLFTNELKKLTLGRDRSIRIETRSGIEKEKAKLKYDKINPKYINTLGSIKIINSNIEVLKKELKNYT